MSDFSDFFGGTLPFKKIQSVYLGGFVKKFPTGNTVLPVPGTTLYFKLPNSNEGTGSSIQLIDNTDSTVVRTFPEINYQTSLVGGALLNAFYLDTSVAPAALYAFTSDAGASTSTPAASTTLKTFKLPADAATPTTTLTAPAGPLPASIGYAYRGSYAQQSVGSTNINGAAFVFPDGAGNLILRGIGPKGMGSDQITIDMTTGAWTSQGSGWFAGAPSGHAAFYTTADGSIATGAITLDTLTLDKSDRGGIVEHLVDAGFHMDKAEFTGGSVNSFCFTRASGCMPVLIGSEYVAMISANTQEFYNAGTGAGVDTMNVKPSNEPNLFLRSDLDKLITDIRNYFFKRVEA